MRCCSDLILSDFSPSHPLCIPGLSASVRPSPHSSCSHLLLYPPRRRILSLRHRRYFRPHSLIPTTNTHDRSCDMGIYFGGENAGRPRYPLRLLFTPCQLYSFHPAAAHPIVLFVYLSTDKNIYPVAASHHMNVESL